MKKISALVLSAIIMFNIFSVQRTANAEALDTGTGGMFIHLTEYDYNSEERELILYTRASNVSSYVITGIESVYMHITKSDDKSLIGDVFFDTVDLGEALNPGDYTYLTFIVTDVEDIDVKSFITADVSTTYYVGEKVNLPAGIKVYVKGQLIQYDVSPEIINNRTMVPLRLTVEALGRTVDWIEATRTAIISTGDDWVEFVVGRDVANTSSGEIYKLDSPMIQKNYRTLVPLRALSTAVGCGVVWGADNKIIIIEN